MLKNKFIIAVDGPDCIGKTTFLDNFFINIKCILKKLSINVNKELKNFLLYISNLNKKKKIKNIDKNSNIYKKIRNFNLGFDKIFSINTNILIIRIKENNFYYNIHKYIKYFDKENISNELFYLAFFSYIRKNIFKSLIKVNKYFYNYKILYLFDRSFISTIIYQICMFLQKHNKLISYDLISQFCIFNYLIQNNVKHDLLLGFFKKKDINSTFNFIIYNLKKTKFKDSYIVIGKKFSNKFFKNNFNVLRQQIYFYKTIFLFLEKETKYIYLIDINDIKYYV